MTLDDRDESELARALDAYLTALESGRPLDPALLAAIHPDIADRLLACIAVLDVTGGPRGGDDPPGGRLGDFALIRPIGRGGMGIVFEARQLSLDRRVAVKVLPFAAALDPVLLGRFQVEARAAARLHHTNIVPVFSVGRERGVHYYAMQLIEGRSLADLIRGLRGDAPTPRTTDGRSDEPPPTEPAVAAVAPALPAPPPPRPPGPSHHRRVAELAVQAADALDYAHREGVVHRDVKPSNMMVDAKGVLWIADFGLARLEADVGLTLHGDLLGTLRYMSPEQSSGDPSAVDARTDVYALGATLYELLTLLPARVGPDRQALLAEIADGEPRPPRSIDRRIPRDLETIVLKALARAPEDRYATAGAMADDLRRFLDGRPILARRPSLVTLAAKWTRRRKGLVSSIVLAALLGVASLTALALAARNRDFARLQRRADYVRDVAQAGHLARRNDLDGAVRLLSQHIPGPGEEDERDFAWDYLWRLGHSRPKRLEGHKGDVYHVEYSPDGRTLVTAGQDATIRTWDAVTGSPLRTFRGHEGDVDWATFSPDGLAIVSCGNDGTIRLWDASDETKPSRLLGRSDVEVVSVAFAPDGRTLYSGDHAGVLTSWDLDGAGSRVLRRLGLRIGSMGLAPDGRSLALAASSTVPRHSGDEPPGFLVVSLDDEVESARAPGFTAGQAATISPDGRLAAAADAFGAVEIATLAPGGVSFGTVRIRSTFTVEGLGFSPDAGVLAGCGRGGMAALWDARTGLLLRTFRSPASRCWSVAFSPDGRRLAATCDDGSIDLWDVVIGQSERRFASPDRVPPRVAPALGGSRFSFLRYDAERRAFSPTSWGESNGEARYDPTIPIGRLAFAAIADDGETAAICDEYAPGIVRLYTRGAPSGERAFPDGCGEFEPRRPPHLAFSPDGAGLVAWLPDGRHVFWDAEGRPASSPPNCISSKPPAFSPDGSRLALLDGDVLRTWAPATGRVVEYPRSRLGFPGAVAFSADGGTVAASAESRALALWDLGDPAAPPRIVNDVGLVQALAFSPDGRLLACSRNDGETTLLDLSSLHPILKLEAPRTDACAVRFTDDGSALLQLSWGEGAAPIFTAWTGGPARPRIHKSR